MIFDFKPDLHPRDRLGRFREVLNSLKPGDGVRTPEGVVTRQRGGMYRVAPRGKRAVDTKSIDFAARAGLTGLTGNQEMTPERSAVQRDRVKDSLLRTVDKPTKGPATPGMEPTVRVAAPMSPGTFPQPTLEEKNRQHLTALQDEVPQYAPAIQRVLDGDANGDDILKTLDAIQQGPLPSNHPQITTTWALTSPDILKALSDDELSRVSGNGADRERERRNASAPTYSDYEAFMNRLDAHDWYYEMSDAQGTWRKGSVERKDLQREADSDPVKAAMYADYKRHKFTGPAWGNEKAPKPELSDYVQEPSVSPPDPLATVTDLPMYSTITVGDGQDARSWTKVPYKFEDEGYLFAGSSNGDLNHREMAGKESNLLSAKEMADEIGTQPVKPGGKPQTIDGPVRFDVPADGVTDRQFMRDGVKFQIVGVRDVDGKKMYVAVDKDGNEVLTPTPGQ